IAIGMLEAVFFVNSPNPGTVDAVLFVIVLVLVLVQRSREADEGAWSLTAKVAAVPERLRNVWWVRRLSLVSGATALAVAAVLPLVFTTSARNFLFARVLLFALIGLS